MNLGDKVYAVIANEVKDVLFYRPILSTIREIRQTKTETLYLLDGVPGIIFPSNRIFTDKAALGRFLNGNICEIDVKDRDTFMPRELWAQHSIIDGLRHRARFREIKNSISVNTARELPEEVDDGEWNSIIDDVCVDEPADIAPDQEMPF